eukprot:gene23928-29034_t
MVSILGPAAEQPAEQSLQIVVAQVEPYQVEEAEEEDPNAPIWEYLALSDCEIEMRVVLRMNRDFMEYMRATYGHLSEQQFNRISVVPNEDPGLNSAEAI